MSVIVDSDKCIGCGKCVDVCPGDLMRLGLCNKAEMRDPADCWDCMACVKACPCTALATRLPYSLADYTASLVPEVSEDKIVWRCIDCDGNEEVFTVKTNDF